MIKPYQHLRFSDSLMEESYLSYSWDLNSTLFKAFILGNVIHSIYVIVLILLTPNNVFTPYSICFVSLCLILSPSILLFLVFNRPYRHWYTDYLWHAFLAIMSVSMALGTSVRNLMCYYGREDPRGCPEGNRPNASNLFIYAALGPILVSTIMRVRRLFETTCFVILIVVLLWNVAIQPGANIAVWFLLIFFVGAFAFATLINYLNEKNERSVYVLRRDLEMNSTELRQEIEQRAIAQRDLEVEVEERKRAQEEAKKAEDARIKFTNYILHEVRGPISAVVLSQNLLESDESLSTISNEARESLAHIRGGLASVQTILNDVLDFAKFTQGQFPLNMRPFDFHQCVKATVWALEATWADKDISFSSSLDEKIDLIPFYLLGDPDRLRQVIGNYLSNAVKFTPTKGHITLRTLLLNGPVRQATIRLEVIDNGIGIAKENHDKLFLDFSQINATENVAVTRGVKGSGLGLAICASIVKSMNGTYGVRSELNQGSTFWFEIPFDVTLEKKREVANKYGVPTSEFHLNILVADDDDITLQVLTRTLKRMGHTVKTAKDGQQALTALMTDVELDVVLIDNSMPIMEGREVIQRARAGGITTPIVSLSGTTERQFSETLLRLGANYVLTKPTTAEMLDRALRAVRSKSPADIASV